MTPPIKQAWTASLCADIKKICAEESFKSYAVLKFPATDTVRFSDALIGTDWSKDAIVNLNRETRVFQSHIVGPLRRTTLPVEINLGQMHNCCRDREAVAQNIGENLSAFCVFDPANSRYIVIFSTYTSCNRNSELVLMKCLLAINDYFSFAVAKVTRAPLSRREIECLSWAAAGKSIEETSIILNLSASTINTYIKSAMRKLDATTKVQAVAQACKMGIL